MVPVTWADRHFFCASVVIRLGLPPRRSTGETNQRPGFVRRKELSKLRDFCSVLGKDFNGCPIAACDIKGVVHAQCTGLKNGVGRLVLGCVKNCEVKKVRCQSPLWFQGFKRESTRAAF